MIAHILKDQINSLALAFVVIFLLIAGILRSGFLSILAIILNGIPVAVVLGFMGATGIKLDVATVTIAAALLGIVVDDTVHILYQLKRSLKEHTFLEDALRDVARHSGLAVLSTSFIFCLGVWCDRNGEPEIRCLRRSAHMLRSSCSAYRRSHCDASNAVFLSGRKTIHTQGSNLSVNCK